MLLNGKARLLPASFLSCLEAKGRVFKHFFLLIMIVSVLPECVLFQLLIAYSIHETIPFTCVGEGHALKSCRLWGLRCPATSLTDLV